MIMALRAGLVLGGVLFLLIALGFLANPDGMGAQFGVSAEGAHGLTSIRSDFGSFFVVVGSCFIWGSLARRPDPLIIGAALLLVTLAGRLVSLAVNGPFDGFIPPMMIELVLGTLALTGARVLPQKAQ